MGGFRYVLFSAFLALVVGRREMDQMEALEVGTEHDGNQHGGTRGVSARDLKMAGFSLPELQKSGFTSADLKKAEFSLGELKENGFISAEIEKVDFSSPDCSPSDALVRQMIDQIDSFGDVDFILGMYRCPPITKAEEFVSEDCFAQLFPVLSKTKSVAEVKQLFNAEKAPSYNEICKPKKTAEVPEDVSGSNVGEDRGAVQQKKPEEEPSKVGWFREEQAVVPHSMEKHLNATTHVDCDMKLPCDELRKQACTKLANHLSGPDGEVEAAGLSCGVCRLPTTAKLSPLKQKVYTNEVNKALKDAPPRIAGEDSRKKEIHTFTRCYLKVSKNNLEWNGVIIDGTDEYGMPEKQIECKCKSCGTKYTKERYLASPIHELFKRKVEARKFSTGERSGELWKCSDHFTGDADVTGVSSTQEFIMTVDVPNFFGPPLFTKPGFKYFGFSDALAPVTNLEPVPSQEMTMKKLKKTADSL